MRSVLPLSVDTPAARPVGCRAGFSPQHGKVSHHAIRSRPLSRSLRRHRAKAYLKVRHKAVRDAMKELKLDGAAADASAGPGLPHQFHRR